jgi:two-component system response regulator RstA|tara:strand:+ start:10497 stop:11225 length:729 start_codon:yes stop_codon:yes gene_type:complete
VDFNKSTQILIVEDDERLAELTREYLTNNGLCVSVEHNGAVAVGRIKAEQPDLVILDLMLPGEDGLGVCRLVRPEYSGPIIMLTARTDELDQVVGLEVGADDYVCKPVAPRLLLARISAMLRRTNKSPAASEITALQNSAGARHHFGSLIIDNAMREAWLGDDDIELTSAEFDLLWLLASNAGRVLSREEIFSALRGISYNGQDRSIDVRVSRIRPKIGDDPDHPRRIKTVRSRGYLFVKAN